MKRLLLLRHAKAEPAAPDEDDHDRALAERGHADAVAMAHYMRAQGYAPDIFLSSTSLRTRQTAEAILKDTLKPVEWLGALYLAPPGMIMSVIQDADDADNVLMVVGHNPGLEQLATLLAREPVKPKEQHRHDVMEEKFPTAALAVLDFDISNWKKITPCGAKLVDFVRPKDL